MDTNRPRALVVVTVIAGVLVVLDGAVLWSQGSYLNVIHPGLGAFSLFYGQTEAAEGFALIGLAFATVIWPRLHFFTGLAIIAIAAISLLGGGGFIIGTPLGILGGFLAIVFRVEYYPEPDEFLPRGTRVGGLYARRPVKGPKPEASSADRVPLLRQTPP